MTKSYDEPRRIYVACLASYNAGTLHGSWIDCDGKDVDALQGEVNAILKASTQPIAEEYAIHDHEGFGDLLEEFSGLKKVAELTETLDEHGEAYGVYASYIGEDYATVEGFREAFQGEYKSEIEWAEQFLEETGMLDAIPENLRAYFDYEAYARDARLNGDVNFIRHDGTLYVYWNN